MCYDCNLSINLQVCETVLLCITDGLVAIGPLTIVLKVSLFSRALVPARCWHVLSQVDTLGISNPARFEESSEFANVIVRSEVVGQVSRSFKNVNTGRDS